MERPSETCRVLFQNKINFEKLVHLVGFTVEIYCDAWPMNIKHCIPYVLANM
jgi:hypothetical protein